MAPNPQATGTSQPQRSGANVANTRATNAPVYTAPSQVPALPSSAFRNSNIAGSTAPVIVGVVPQHIPGRPNLAANAAVPQPQPVLQQFNTAARTAPLSSGMLSPNSTAVANSTPAKRGPGSEQLPGRPTFADKAGQAVEKVGGTLKTAGNAVIAAEKAAAADITAAIGASRNEDRFIQIRQQEALQFKELVRQRDAARAAGRDASKLDQQIKNFTYTKDNTAELYPAINKSNGQVIADFAGVALDAASAGAVGTAARGAKATEAARSIEIVSGVERGAPKMTVGTAARPTATESEVFVGKDLGAGARPQVSYKDGVEVPYGTKGSVRPDWVSGNKSIEVKARSIEYPSQIAANVADQFSKRLVNLPEGLQLNQTVVIDIRGQRVTQDQMARVRELITGATKGGIQPGDIIFLQ